MFVKIYEQIFDSSIAEDLELRTFFIDLLILADKEGIVDRTPDAIARRTKRPLEQVARLIQRLSEPDPMSRSREEEGRRLVLLNPERTWGWRVVNYATYREIKTEFDRNAYMRNYMRQYRQSESPSPVKLCKTNVKLTSASEYGSVPEEVQEKPNLGPVMIRELNDLFNRKPNKRWIYSEECALAEVLRDNPECLAELEELKAFRQKDPRYFPHSIGALLQNWTSTLDRARSQVPDTPKEKSILDKEVERLKRISQ